ncbi:MAG TPA: arginine--tRNA ligase [Acidimicrobiales bacterium]|nr:arginine--tRNA ligase [Acidimicrobiales bacterium]
MPDATSVLLQRLQAAFDTVVPGADPVLRPSDRADFQANGALALAKAVGRSPQQVAADVVAVADLADLCASVEISGPGFINLTLADDFVADQVAAVGADPRLGVALSPDPQRLVLDYSGPNMAKEMHIGHLRSTVIGDALARVLTFQGHQVLRENHIGDWGTPFGMLIEYLVDIGGSADAASFSVRDLNEFYGQARKLFDGDPDFAERCRQRVVLLQGGDEETLALWEIFVGESLRHIDEVYEMLGVLLTDDDVAGESSYNDLLPVVVGELAAQDLLVEHEGALCVFPAGFENRNGDPLPLIVRKSDQGYGYPATDLACIRDRTGRRGATRLVYVVGAEQALHFRLVFAVATLAGYLPEVSAAVHVGFGMILGPDGKKLASRSGESERLIDLLTEGVERAKAAMGERPSDLSPEEQAHLARVVGIGAVKYADLSTERMRDYIFDWDRMLAFEGNTGPYLQYAHARVRSIFRRADVPPPAPGTRPMVGEAPERALAMQLLGFGDAVAATAEAYSAAKLCAYLFDLASVFTTFYEACRVLVEDEAVRTSRLALCDLTARVLDQGLALLGMEAPDRM